MKHFTALTLPVIRTRLLTQINYRNSSPFYAFVRNFCISWIREQNRNISSRLCSVKYYRCFLKSLIDDATPSSAEKTKESTIIGQRTVEKCYSRTLGAPVDDSSQPIFVSARFETFLSHAYNPCERLVYYSPFPAVNVRNKRTTMPSGKIEWLMFGSVFCFITSFAFLISSFLSHHFTKRKTFARKAGSRASKER